MCVCEAATKGKHTFAPKWMCANFFSFLCRKRQGLSGYAAKGGLFAKTVCYKLGFCKCDRNRLPELSDAISQAPFSSYHKTEKMAHRSHGCRICKSQDRRCVCA